MASGTTSLPPFAFLFRLALLLTFLSPSAMLHAESKAEIPQQEAIKQAAIREFQKDGNNIENYEAPDIHLHRPGGNPGIHKNHLLAAKLKGKSYFRIVFRKKPAAFARHLVVIFVEDTPGHPVLGSTLSR